MRCHVLIAEAELRPLTLVDRLRLQEGLRRFGKLHGAVAKQSIRLDACMRAADWGSVSPLAIQPSPKLERESVGRSLA